MLGERVGERHAAICVHRIPLFHGVIWEDWSFRALAPWHFVVCVPSPPLAPSSPLVVVFTGVRLAKPLSVYVEEGVGVGSVDMCVSGYV